MINPKEIEEYLDWKRSRELYPPTNSPDEYVELLEMSAARDKINIIKGLLMAEETTIEDIEEIIYDAKDR